MKKQVIAISVAAITTLSLMACSGQKAEDNTSSAAQTIKYKKKITIKYKKKIQLQWKKKHGIIKYCDT